MKHVECFLKDHWFAKRAIGRLMFDLGCAKAAYENSTAFMPSASVMELSGVKAHGNLSPVEKSVIIIAQQHHAEMQTIERRLKHEREIVRRIEQAVADAQLAARESEFVRLRYFDNQSMQAVSCRMHCSIATCGRIRRGALEKLGRAHGE